MTSTDLARRSPAHLPAGPAADLPRWRDRLEQLWLRQVEEIIDVSAAFHEAASARPAGGRPEAAGHDPRRLRPILVRAAVAHRALAEIEAALGRLDAGRYGICGHCGLGLQAGWLDASPQARYCPACRPQ
jgi:DnaK suppressor protein